jgi:hypothetical protein
MDQHRSKYDVVHAHNLSWFGGFAIPVAKALRKPVLVKLPTATEYAFPEGSARFRIFEACDAIALLSEDTIEDFRRRGFLRKSHLQDHQRNRARGFRRRERRIRASRWR